LMVFNRDAAMCYLGPAPSFISAVIAKRGILDCLTEKEVLDYAEYGFNQMYAFYKGLSSKSVGLISSNVLLHARSDQGGINYSWNKFFVRGMSQVFMDLGAKGFYSKKSINSGLGEVVLRYHIWRMLNEKSQGKDVSELNSLVKFYFNTTWEYVFIYRPLNFVPSCFLRLVKKVKKKLRIISAS
jgi:hypothetical protein